MTSEELTRIDVNLREKAYPIFIGSNFLPQIGTLIQPYTRSKKMFLITDTLLEALYLPYVLEGLEAAGYEVYTLTIEMGEGSKTFQEAEKLLEKMLKIGCDRECAIVSLGGGVVGDLAGFCASILLRGVDFIQIPTTLLAQTDSSVGGKTAVNMAAGKNLVGSFYQPKAVFIDVHTLKTLDEHQVLAGFGEVVKYGLALNADFWNWLETAGDQILAMNEEMCRYAVEQCCRIKAAVVESDELEQTGLRSLLNFGHTFAHAIEAVSGMRGAILHGEAVAIGSILAAWLSVDMNLCSQELPEKISAQFEKWGLPTQFDATLKNSDLIAAMKKDKKTTGDHLNFVLLESIGNSVLAHDVPIKSVEYIFNEKGRKKSGFSFY
ncbi:MAG: 3-dehydroquinate synthase [Alphaproteobacteria bacterium]|nr:3-dehydroquinate synthase [Alphaproteobacteria bacterium]